MRQLWENLLQQWQTKWPFRLALLYLLLLVVLVLVLPALPLPYSPGYLDLNYAFLPPFSESALATQHWLGTDGLGRDILSNLLYGARSAFLISFPVMTVATLFGLLIGVSSGYFGDKGLVMPRYLLLALVVTMAVSCYYGLYIPLQVMEFKLPFTYATQALSALLGLVLLCALLAKILASYTFWKRKVKLPADWLVLRSIEALNTIPRFVLILVLASFMPPSVLLLSLLLVFTLWPTPARLARAEMLKIKELPYFEAARSVGTPPLLLIWRHAIPNLLGPVLVAFTFGLGGLLALESTLSFLNIGLPTTFVSWGRTIAGFRTNTAAWWLVAFPGGLLSITVLAIYTCSHYLTKLFSTKK
ncbi:ABC transporter permease [Pontibacter akesuensis]|uniref:Peptide/nickel transport system permease protein n=1 Tax=Pontibacter akesuensis TaxID=388950 RepID=A0A1I7GF42_9BACT|nr:ABC transporter permease [Pontibacter akesuensis]GHA57199.1 peptide ABC transporter permease [Pontibacter akesuensis]SFU46886.1 peptide/nickel transport system permease protein [Pontibacter akesuensis]